MVEQSVPDSWGTHISMAIWDGARIISSYTGEDGDPLIGHFGSGGAVIDLSYCGRFAAATAGDRHGPEGHGVLVLSDDGAVTPLWGKRGRTANNVAPGAQFSPDGYLYKWDGTERCRVGEWAPEPTGIPPGAYFFKIDGANNCAWVAYLDPITQGPTAQLKRFELSTHSEVPLGFDMPDIPGERNWLSVATSPSGDFIDLGIAEQWPAPARRLLINLTSGSVLAPRTEARPDSGPIAGRSVLGQTSLVRIGMPDSSNTIQIQVTDLSTLLTTAAAPFTQASGTWGPIVTPSVGEGISPGFLVDGGAIFLPSDGGSGFGETFSALSLVDGSMVAPPAAFEVQKVVPSPDGNYTCTYAAAAQPRILPPLPPGEVWNKFRYTREA